MKKLVAAVFVLLISTTVYAQTVDSRQDRAGEKANASLNNVQRKMVARAEDVADWMIATAGPSAGTIDKQTAARAAEVLVSLSRTEEGRNILTSPSMLTDQLNKNGISAKTVIEASIRAAEALRQPKLGGLSIREIVTMPLTVAIQQYPEAIGGEIMLRGSTVKLAEAQQAVEILGPMIEKDPNIFFGHSATVKMELINTWGVSPELADIIIQVTGTNEELMEIVVPSWEPQARQTAGTMESRFKEAIKYLQSRGRIDDANKIKASMKKGGTELLLSEIEEKRGEATIASPLELGIAIHFLETIHPEGAEFVKEMAAEDRLGSMGLQQYIALIKKEMSHEWINIINRNALGHIAIGDINQQMKKYENDLRRYAEMGGGKISIMKLAEDYIRVGGREMPYDLVSLMAKEPIYPDQLKIAFVARESSLEPTQMAAIETLSGYLPSGIREILEEAGDKIDLKPYEIEGIIRNLEVFRVRAASVQALEESQGLLLDETNSFLVYVIASKPKAVVWLSLVSQPVHEGDARIIINEMMQKAMVEFSGIPVLRFDYAGEMEVLGLTEKGITLRKFDEETAAEFESRNLKPIYVGGSPAELAALQEKAFMLPLYGILREKMAAKFNMPTLSTIEEAFTMIKAVTMSRGISLEGIDWTVIPTQFDELAFVSVPFEVYKTIEKHQQKATEDLASGSEIYFFTDNGRFFRFEGDSNILGQRVQREMDVFELQQKIYQGNAVIFAASSFFIDQPTAFELFGNKNYFKYRGGLVSFDDPYLTELQMKAFLATVDALDVEMGSLFAGNRPDNKNAWNVLNGVRVTNATDHKAQLIYFSRGIRRKEKYILEVSSDLARNPALIKMRLRNMTADQIIQEQTVRDTSSLSTGILESFEPGVKETTKDKVVKWITSKLRNRIEGSSLQGMVIQERSFNEGTVFLEKEFPEKIKVGLLADITKEIINAKGADQVRMVLSGTSE